jgi:hypothetical protein
VNDVLDFAKLGTNNVEICPTKSNLQDTLNTILHSIEMRAGTRDQSLHVTYDPNLPKEVTCDSRRLQQILFNLLGNALKFSRDSGVVEFRVEYVENETECCPVGVSAGCDHINEHGDTERMMRENEERGVTAIPSDDFPPSRCPFQKMTPTFGLNPAAASGVTTMILNVTMTQSHASPRHL